MCFKRKNIFIKANISKNENQVNVNIKESITLINRGYLKNTTVVALGLNLCLCEEKVEE